MGLRQSAPEVGGFRIFKVNPGSPASEAGLEVFFDFIVEIAGSKMDSDQKHFFKKIQESENKSTKLVVHNIRTHTSRDVFVTPRKWGGAGLLGAVVRYDTLDNADNQGIRVLAVFPNSPAQHAGLVPYKDYLLGTTEVLFRDLDELVEIVNLCLGSSMQISVYNSDTESIRDVTIVPNNSWGGDGSIGADIRTGLLHRIPAPRRLFTYAPEAVTPAHLLQSALYPASGLALEPAVPTAPAAPPTATLTSFVEATAQNAPTLAAPELTHLSTPIHTAVIPVGGQVVEAQPTLVATANGTASTSMPLCLQPERSWSMQPGVEVAPPATGASGVVLGASTTVAGLEPAHIVPSALVVPPTSLHPDAGPVTVVLEPELVVAQPAWLEAQTVDQQIQEVSHKLADFSAAEFESPHQSSAMTSVDPSLSATAKHPNASQHEDNLLAQSAPGMIVDAPLPTTELGVLPPMVLQSPQPPGVIYEVPAQPTAAAWF